MAERRAPSAFINYAFEIMNERVIVVSVSLYQFHLFASSRRYCIEPVQGR